MRGSRGHSLIERAALVSRLADESVVLLEAPSGFGKSVLAVQLAEHREGPVVRATMNDAAVDRSSLVADLARGARRAGVPDVAALLTAGDPGAVARLGGGTGLTIVVDGVERLEPAAVEWLAALAAELPPASALIVTGRRVGSALIALVRRDDAALVGPEALRFDDDDIAAAIRAQLDRVAEPHETVAVAALTDGWPAAVAVVTARLGDGWSPTTAASGAGALAGLVDAQLAAADAPLCSLVARLAHLPLLSAEVAAVLGGEGALDRVLDLGLPIRFRPDGWGELPAPVVELLRPRAELDVAEGRAVAVVYERHGESGQAAALLHRLGDLEGLADLLAGLRWDRLIDLGAPVLGTLVDALPDELLADRVPLLVQAALAAELHAPERRPAWVDRAHQLAPVSGPARRAVDAERARQLARDGDLDGAVGLATQVIEAAPPDELFTRGHAHFTRALAELVRENGAGDPQVVDDLESAAALFRLAGEPRWESNVLQALGLGVLLQQGAFTAAVEQLQSAVALLAAPDVIRGLALTYLAEGLSHAGRLDDADVALRAATEIGRRLAHHDLIGYAAWGRAEVSARRRDRAGVEAALGEAVRHGGSWIDRMPAIDFFAAGAEFRLVVGDEEGARRDLAEAERRSEGSDYVMPTLTVRARLEATTGDPQAAEAVLDELEAVGVPRDRWLWLLLRAVCAHRAGQPERAGELQRASERSAADLDDPTRLARREPELLALVGDVGAAARTPARVVLLGGFDVRIAAQDARPAPGHPSTLVKLVALRRLMPVDEAVDLLWSDADLETGRRRLRNLLNRLKATTPGVVERRESSLVLGDGVEVDVHSFEDAAAAALAADQSARAGLARQALAHHTGELLPGDRYDDWAAAPRERVQRRFVALADLVAEDARTRGDADELIRLLDLAIAAEPLDPARYVVAAATLAEQGRAGAAQAMARRGIEVAEELGLDPDPALLTIDVDVPAGRMRR